MSRSLLIIRAPVVDGVNFLHFYNGWQQADDMRFLPDWQKCNKPNSAVDRLTFDEKRGNMIQC